MSTKILKVTLPLLLLVLVTGCGKKKGNTVEEQKAVQVEVTKVAVQSISQSGTFTATVQAETKNNIAPQNAGRIRKVYVEVGDRVQTGQKLVEMDQVNLEQTKLQMENHKTEFERVDELYKVGGISRSSWDSRKLAYELSLAAYENLVENTTLLSPSNGIVTKRNYDSGDMFAMSAPIYVVEQIRPVKLITNVSESLFMKIKKGMSVDISIDIFGDEVFKGTVRLVHPSIDPVTRTFPVEVHIPNNDERIRPGMFARVTFNYGEKDAIVISDRAIVKQAGSADRFVYVCNGGKADFRKITLGERVGNDYEVLDGLQDGDVVAVTGQSRLFSGAEIDIVN